MKIEVSRWPSSLATSNSALVSEPVGIRLRSR
jgi:hypothetical protein